MRSRNFVLGCFTALVALLGLVSPAHAVRVADLKCTSASNMVTCSMAVADVDTSGGREGGPVTINWTSGGAYPEGSKNKTIHSFRCAPRIFDGIGILVRVTVQQGIGPSAFDDDFVFVTCVGSFFRGLFSLICEPTPTALALVPNGNYIVCHTAWSPDGSEASVRWVSQQAQRAPAVTTNSAEGWTRATFNCNNPGGPDLTFNSFAEVTDASGTMRSNATIPCGW